MLSKLIYKTMLTSYNILVCEQASSEVGKKFGERSEWESERRDSASEAHALLTRLLSARPARPRLHSVNSQ